ncbi:MAG: hypothetical protein A2790_08960 [Phenylobacterium sp. RIFCSPHIGHO2_01_FULL_69_31]|uniref:calcium-binding protein n=1 Tax=Phenylobacterium sp. RIFCSPHIGHO2_01_FULL_69_31 TaxID=1801944 RepID=UPI0008C2AC77|nr:calcium-binding protein [Phenylobacterium sp. RIFCSPHIGHO2_01_FULL_69_31]OHB30136.1 MAG: hypothetical protein A2790_08960 [Phenylobacterium sp. RIFCSPHIGHO2_01_FULL_69_31]
MPTLNVPASGPATTISFNPAAGGRAIGQVTLPTQMGVTFVKLDIPQGAQTIQVRLLPDQTDTGLTGLVEEAWLSASLYREVEPGQFLITTIHGSRSVDDPYIGALDPDRIQEFDFPVTAATRDPHSTLSGRGAFFLVIEGQATPNIMGGFLSGRVAIEVSVDQAGPTGVDPRNVLWGPGWIQPYGEANPGAPTGPVQPGPVLAPTAGPDTLIGGAGNETIDGGGGEDYIRGGDGNDQIRGGTAFDDVHGNTGNDTVYGGLDHDWVVGGKGEDALFGDDGNDLVLGNIGADTCEGGAGADTVRGGQDNDIIRGGAGADYVSGDKGADTVSGGEGADLFHSFGDAGIDRVLDFNRAEGDRVLLDPGTQYTVSQVGADTVISMTGGGEMILVGVQASSLTSGWILVG